VEALLEHAREVERALQRHTDLGDLRIGATLTIGNYLAVGLMARYMNEQPGAKVALTVANTAEIVAKVVNFELDLGLVEGELQHSDLEITPWREDELALFCAPGHPLLSKTELTDADLIAATWILREPGSGTRQCFDRGMQGLLPELKVLLELQHTEAIKRAVEAGLGVGCISRVALRDAFRRGSLVPLPITQRSFRRHFYFLVHQQKYRSAGMQRWLTLCRELPDET
jgi:DNA-binding transcriptional LysR family regulator